nr:L-fucose kinase-like [Parasteatoda tepidariorum]
MNKYWDQKKILAPGCEPVLIKEIMDILKPLCYGQLLVGAGGGGFMCVLTKELNAMESLKTSLTIYKEYNKLTFHKVNIDLDGLIVS